MVDTTGARGYRKPENTDHTRLWEHIGDLADDVDTDVDALYERPLCKVVQNTTQSIAHASGVLLLFDVEVVDTHGFHSTSSNTSRITPTVPGWYEFTGTFFVPSRSGGYSTLGIVVRKNGSAEIPPWIRKTDQLDAGSKSIQVSTTEQANGTTDYFALIVEQQNSGAGAVNTPASGSFCAVFECKFLRPL
jgi:hypothetical protein